MLETVQELSGQFALIYEFHQAGAGCYRETGQPITAEALEAFQRVNATLKGPVGLPDVRKPDGTEAGLLGGVLRVDFDLYANLRPIRLFPNVLTPLAAKDPDSIDYIILRESSEGLYLSRGVGLKTRDAATDSMMMTRRGCERIARYAFRLAMEKHRGAPEDNHDASPSSTKAMFCGPSLFSEIFFSNVAPIFPRSRRNAFTWMPRPRPWSTGPAISRSS